MTGRGSGRVLGRLLLTATLAALVLVPGSEVRPTTLSLTTVHGAKGVDLRDGPLWLLVLGSDARPGQDVTEGNTDAIQLVGIDPATGRAVAIGIPRDTHLRLPGVGMTRINRALAVGGPELAAGKVTEVVGVRPDYVLALGFDGFRRLVGTVGELRVRTPEGFVNDGVTVRAGQNTFGPGEALAYVRYRRGLSDYDFGRSRNHQRVMLSALTRLRAREDAEGFMEGAALAALESVETDLGPTELYRLAQALTMVEPRQVTSCVLPGSPGTGAGGSSVVELDVAAARRIGRDARDLHLDRGCR